MTSARPRIAVIGAGVIGLSAARALARLDAQVTVFERVHIGAGTSGTTFAWINSNGKNPDSYHALNCAGMREHVELQRSATTQARWLDVCGTYEWAVDAAQRERLEARVQALVARGYPVRCVEREALQAAVPELRLDRRAGAVWCFPDEALAFPGILLAWLWSEAQRHGASLQGTGVVDIAEHPHGVALELSSGERWRGDMAVLAAGRWTSELAGRLGAPLAMIDASQPDKRACGFLAVTSPQPVQLRSNLITPELNLRPEGGGRLLLQAPDLDERADPAYRAALDGYVGGEILRRLHRLFPGAVHGGIERLAVGQRARPVDGLPAIGFLTRAQRVYVMATHSGMTLGPLLGRLAAEELVNRRRDPLLADYAPERLVNRKAESFAPLATLHFPAEQ